MGKFVVVVGKRAAWGNEKSGGKFANFKQVVSLAFILAPVFCFILTAGAARPVFAAASYTEVIASADNATITLGDEVTVENLNASGYIVNAQGANSKIQFGTGATVTASGGSGAVIARGTNSEIVFGNDAVISAQGYAVYSQGANSAIRIGAGSVVSADGVSSRAIWASGADSAISVDNGSKVYASGHQAYGVYVANQYNSKLNHQVWMGDDIEIHINGYEATGVLAQGERVQLTIGDRAYLTAEGGRSSAARLEWGSFDIGDALVVSADAPGAKGVQVGYESTLIGASSVDVTAAKIGNGATISVSGEMARGLFSTMAASLDVGADLHVSATGKDARGIEVLSKLVPDAAPSATHIGERLVIPLPGRVRTVFMRSPAYRSPRLRSVKMPRLTCTAPVRPGFTRGE